MLGRYFGHNIQKVSLQNGDRKLHENPYLRPGTKYKSIGFEVHTAVVMYVATFRDIAPYSPYVYRCFRWTYRLHLQGLISAYALSHLLYVGFLLGWFSALKIIVISSSETSVHIRTTRCYIPEDCNIQILEWLRGWADNVTRTDIRMLDNLSRKWMEQSRGLSITHVKITWILMK
jgi:hypothetical protein